MFDAARATTTAAAVLEVVLAIIAAVFVTVVILPIVAFTAPAALAIPTIEISLGVGGIVIGLIIAFFQHKQGNEIHKQTERIEAQDRETKKVVDQVDRESGRIGKQSDKISAVVNQVDEQSAEIGDVVYQVNAQTNNMAKVLGEVRILNHQIWTMVQEAKIREDKRKHFHLSHAKAHAADIKNVVIETVEDIEKKYVKKFPAPRIEEYERTRDYVENTIIKQLHSRLKQISGHFNEVKDLMNSPDLPSRVVVNHLWTTLDSLIRLVRQAHPMYDRQIFLMSLHEIKDRQIPSLCQALQELEKEIPKVYGPSSESDPSSPPA